MWFLISHTLAGLGHLVAGLLSTVVSLAVLAGLGWLVFSGAIRAQLEASRLKQIAAAEVARAAEVKQQREQREAAKAADTSPKFPIAVTTGILRERGHLGAPPKGKTLWQRERDLAQGIAVVGQPGTGKSYLVILPFTGWMAKSPDVGIFAIATKRGFADDLERQIRVGRPDAVVKRVGVDDLRWSLMKGLSPDSVGAFVRVVGERKGGAADSTWSDAATLHASTCALLLDALTAGGREVFRVSTPTSGGLDAISREYTYDFVGLHRVANLQPMSAKKDDDEGGGVNVAAAPCEWEAFVVEARATMAMLRGIGDRESEDRAQQIEIALDARALEFDALGDRTRSSVLMSVNNVLGPLVRNVELRRTFAAGTDVRLEDLDDGTCIILDIDGDRYGAAAEFLFMLAFQQFAGFGLRRMATAKTSVAFVGDEFASYASPKVMDFFALSRQAKIIPCISFQSLSQLTTKVGRKEVAHAIVSTIGTTVWFPGSDPETTQYVSQIVGSADVTMESTSTAEGENRGDSSSWSMHGGGTGQSSGWSSTTTTSTSLQQRSVVDAHLMRTLCSWFPNPNRGEHGRGWAEAVGFVRSEGRIVDDVVKLWGEEI